MRNTYLWGLGGALLATTSLSTAGYAATLYNGKGLVQSKANLLAANGKLVAAQQFGTGGVTSGVNGAKFPVTVAFTNAYSKGLTFKAILTVTGANFATTSLNSQLNTNITVVMSTSVLSGTGTTTGTIGGGTAGCTVGVLSSQVQVSGCATATVTSSNGVLISGLILSGLIYTAATGLATVGSTVSLGGNIVDATNNTNTFEAITAVAHLTSVNAVSTPIQTSAVSVNQGVAGVAFSTVSQSASSGKAYIPAATALTAVLAEIQITGTGALDFQTFAAVTATNAVGPLALTVTDTALADPAISNVRFVHTNTATTFTNTTLTSTATFAATQLTNAVVYDTASVAGGKNFVQIEYGGTAGIAGGTGTVAGTFTANSATYPGLQPAIASTAVSGINRAGLVTTINAVQASANTAVSSFIRITNSAAASGIATVTVYNGSTGAALGTFTTAAIPGYSTLQLTAANIEGSAGIATGTASSYTLNISGAFTGYLQHVTANGATGVYTDFSGRRSSLGNGQGS